MAVLSLTDAEILAGPLRMTGRSNRIDVNMTAVPINCTTFDSGGWDEHLMGQRKLAASTGGFYDASPIETGALNFDSEVFTGLTGGAQFPLTVCPTKADGSVAYVGGFRRGMITQGGAVGEAMRLDSEMRGDGAMGRGALIHPANVLRTAGGTGAAVVLGTVATGQRLLVAIHVVAISGTSPELTLTVQRDDGAGFASPTTVVTTGALSACTSSLTSVAGPITPDDRYRVIWTLTGTDPSARFAVAVATTNTI